MLSTRGTLSRSPLLKLLKGKHPAAGMYPSKPAPANPSNLATRSPAPAATRWSHPPRDARLCTPPRSRQSATLSPGSPATMCANKFQGNPAEVSPRTPAHKCLTPSVLKNVHLFIFPFFYISFFYNEFTNYTTLKYRL